jgi:membrane fusion protein (multidrug efflux system)
VVVPEEAVIARGQQRFVFVVRDGVATAREVTTGERLPGKVEIARGLTAGDTIVRIGQDQLHVEKPTPIVVPPPAGAG